MKKLTSFLLAAAILVCLCACGSQKADEINSDPGASSAPADVRPKTEYDSKNESAASPLAVTMENFQPAADYDEIYAFLSQPVEDSNIFRGADSAEAEIMEEPAADSSYVSSEEKNGAGGDYSGTNVQVSGIDEGDIVKTDGKYFYVLQNGTTLTIFSAEGEASAVVSRTELASGYNYAEKDENSYSSEYKYVQEIYLADGRMVAVGDYYFDSSVYADGEYQYTSTNYTFVDIYDVSDPNTPKLVESLGQDGYRNASRLMNGKLYLVTNKWLYSGMDENAPESFVPGIYRNGQGSAMRADCIYLCLGKTGQSYCVVCAYDLESAEISSQLSILGGSNEIYMNENSIYLFDSEWTNEEAESYQESVYQVSRRMDYSRTVICRMDVSDGGLRLAGSAAVPGYMNNQFSADEYKGYLRIVTTTSVTNYLVFTDPAYDFVNYQYEDGSVSSGLYVLDGDLNLIGSVDQLAEEESVYSARFDGDIAYFCTYRNIDPLFAVDVSNPAEPIVLSELKISGFSEYLHQWDADRLFGFGLETDEENGWTEGLKLVMFDTTDKTEILVENELVMDKHYSNALYNHKAMFIDSEKNLIGFCCDSAYYIYSYSPELGFTLQTKFWFDTYEYDVRGFWNGDWAYLIGSEQAMIVNTKDWSRMIGLKISE